MMTSRTISTMVVLLLIGNSMNSGTRMLAISDDTTTDDKSTGSEANDPCENIEDCSIPKSETSYIVLNPIYTSNSTDTSTSVIMDAEPDSNDIGNIEVDSDPDEKAEEGLENVEMIHDGYEHMEAITEPMFESLGEMMSTESTVDAVSNVMDGVPME